MKTPERRRRPALGDERRARHGVSEGADRSLLGYLTSDHTRTGMMVVGTSFIFLAATFIAVQALGGDDSPERIAGLVETPTPAESSVPQPTPEPVRTPDPIPSPSPSPPRIDPTVLSDGALTLVAPDGSLRLLTEDGEEQVLAEDVLHPALHPDGDAIAFVRYDGFTSEIWMWVAGEGADLLGSREGLVRNLEWNDEGDALLYHVLQEDGETTVIRRYDFFWEDAETLLASDQFDVEGASIQGFSVFPDGALAVQVATGDESHSCAIYVVDAGLDDAEQLTGTADGTCFSHPAVSPDGQQVAFIVSTPDGTAQVAVVNTDGSDLRELAVVASPDSGIDDFWPRIAWSPDSEIVLYEATADGETVYAQAASDTEGDTRRLVAQGRHPAWH